MSNTDENTNPNLKPRSCKSKSPQPAAKRRWIKQEDKKLLRIVTKYETPGKTKRTALWDKVAKEMKSRSGRSCKMRWSKSRDSDAHLTFAVI